MLIIFLNREGLKFGQMDVLYFSYTMAYMAMDKKIIITFKVKRVLCTLDEQWSALHFWRI